MSDVNDIASLTPLANIYLPPTGLKNWNNRHNAANLRGEIRSLKLFTHTGAILQKPLI
ncbi:MAG: hypothetical protein KDB03_19430 [Planctomycetales bacterium]|nr:hypothetical protein [Planctomycetales bacterium]